MLRFGVPGAPRARGRRDARRGRGGVAGERGGQRDAPLGPDEHPLQDETYVLSKSKLERIFVIFNFF